MKGKKLIACMISAMLLAGSMTSVYGADFETAEETPVGAAYADAPATTDGNAVTPDDESLAAVSETEINQSETSEENISEGITEAVPESVENAAGEIGSTVGISAAGISETTESGDISDTSSLTESRTESLTDSSISDLNRKQETLVGATYTSAEPADGKTYYIRCASNRNYTLTVSGNSVDNQANIVISKLEKTLNQKFMCRKMSDGTFVFTNLHSGKALRIAGNTPKNSANLWQHEFNSANSARWKALKNPDGSYRIGSKLNTSFVIDIHAGAIANNTNVQVYKWNKTVAQKFIFTETPVPSYAGTVQLRPANGTHMCVAPAKNSSASGAHVEITDADNQDILLYNAVKYSAGYYVLVNKSNGLVLSVQNSENKSGANIIQEKRNNRFCQQWLMRKNSDGTYTYLSRLNSCLALTAKSGGTKAGTIMTLSVFKNYSSQRFYPGVYTASIVPTCQIYIRSVVNSDRVMDVSGAGTADGTNIDCYDWNETAAQKFRIEPVAYGTTTNVWYRIISVPSGKVLQVAGGNAAAGANIELGTYKKTKAQLWHPELKSDGCFTFRSALNTSLAIESTGSEAYGANIRLGTYNSVAKQKWFLTSVQITKTAVSYTDHSTVTVQATGAKQASDTGHAYLFAISPYGKTIKSYKPLASANMGTSYVFHVPLNKNSAGSLLHRKFYIATVNHGVYRVISNPFFITNPQAAATNQKAFPTPARGTKKGIKTGADSVGMAKNLNCSHVVLDLPIDGFLGGSDLAYKYEGTTYHFSSIIDVYGDRIKTYNNAGIVVTGIFYMYDSSNTAYMYPAAASGSRRHSATLYALNTRDGNRKRLEALFACLAERWSTNGITLANWIYGNELQQYNVYNYTGDISYSEYHEALAEGFRMFNASIKSRWSNARTYISLDHNWNLSWNVAGTYNGMQLTADFNTDLKRQGLCHWDMAMHPYPSPEQDCRFWNRAFTVENSGASQQITMLNARYFSSYIKKTYGNSTHVIMSETGLSSVYNGKQQQGEQAASVAFAYYLAEFDPNIDMLAIHRDYDNSGETSGGWWLGIYNSNGSAKPSADVFKYMDTRSWSSHVNHYMNSYIGSDWKSKISGFDANFFTNK